jgi:hypothetical protein
VRLLLHNLDIDIYPFIDSEEKVRSFHQSLVPAKKIMHKTIGFELVIGDILRFTYEDHKTLLAIGMFYINQDMFNLYVNFKKERER